MRRWWRAAAAAALTVGLLGLAPGAAGAETTVDTCSGADGPPDLQDASFTYSASSFSVGASFCSQGITYGEYAVTIHLTSFTPEVQVTAAFQDLGKYLGYSGYRVCAAAQCTTTHDGAGFLTPSGIALDGPCLYDVYTCSRRSTSAYGAWADLLPAGTAIPETIAWYADVKVYDATTRDASRVVDRAPKSGTVSANRNAATIATAVRATPGPAPAVSPYAYRTDTGRLLTPAGGPISDRLIRIRPVSYKGLRTESTSTGSWTGSYGLSRNTTVQACFRGDGVHDPSCSDPYLATEKAFVSLDLNQRTSIARGHPLVLRGVVRPHESGQVRVLIREDRAGATYRLLRYTTLLQNGDSYYRTTWSPTVRGRYVLRTVWNGGSTAEGAVLSNISTYRYVTVT